MEKPGMKPGKTDIVSDEESEQLPPLLMINLIPKRALIHHAGVLMTLASSLWSLLCHLMLSMAYANSVTMSR